MVTMVDEIYDRHYQAARGDLNPAILRALSRLAGTVHKTFQVLVGIEYESPWATKAQKVRSN